jgi:Ser/Thr protein kinase RdoA (MazF antagonist)
MIRPEALPGELMTTLRLPQATSAMRMPGYEAAVWRADLSDGRTVAVRLLRRGVPGDPELMALRMAGELGQPAPAVVAHGQWDGRDAIVSTWCAGRSMGELLEDGGDPWALGTLMGRAQAGLHEPAADGRALCHLDFQPFNILVLDETITGIVDWGNAKLTDRRHDLAWTMVVLALAPALLPDFVPVIDAFGAAWRDGYRQIRELPPEADLQPFLAEAAAKQLSDWAPRAAAEECPASVADAARAIVARWSG